MSDKTEKFDVRYDAKSKLLRWTLRGFWSLADVASFAEAMQTALERLGGPPHRYNGLCDARDFPVQSAEVSKAFTEVGRIGSSTREGRVAIVVGGAMNKLQAQRTLTGEGIRVFLSMEDAQAWLRTPTTGTT